MAEPVLRDDLYERHVERRGTDEHGGLRRPETLTPEQRRARADAAIAELEGGYDEEEAARRYEQLREARRYLHEESADNSLTSSTLWRRFDHDSARSSEADAVADLLGV
jgi:hypothetical protein